MNAYLELKNRQSEEFNKFPMFFAFNDKQFEEGMKKIGLNPDQTDMIYKIDGGGFYKKEEAKHLKELLERHTKEQEDAIKADPTGEGYIFEMFKYELNNHEYCYTLDPTDALESLCISMDEIDKKPSLQVGFQEALTVCMSESS